MLDISLEKKTVEVALTGNTIEIAISPPKTLQVSLGGVRGEPGPVGPEATIDGAALIAAFQAELN